MSGQFLNDGSQRVNMEETLIIRKELIDLLQLDNSFFNIHGITPDYYGNTNLLLPNPIQEKNDNGDIDIFLFYDKNLHNKEQLINLIHNHQNVIKVSKNDQIWSFLYHSKNIDKKIQIDLHIIENTKININNYFEYYRVPYLYFILGQMLFFHINIKISIHGIFFNIDEIIDSNGSKINEFVLIDNSINNFLKNILNIKEYDIRYIDSYKKITEFILDNKLEQYSIWKNKDESKGSVKKKLNNNDKLQIIINGLPDGNKSMNEFKEIYIKILFEKYPFIKNKKDALIKEFIIQRQNKIERQEKLQLLYGKELKDLDIDEKKYISKFGTVVNELLILKEMASIINNKYGKNIYLVGGAVRDIIMDNGCNDWDLSGNIHPNDFADLFGGQITEKYGTVFTQYKGLEIEYTPFRIESGFDGRHVNEIKFSNDIMDDVKRRDFTINSIYLDLYNIKIIDIYNGVNDIQKGIIKCVGNHSDRFKEDYLRILRGLRLSAKYNFNIDNETYLSMIENVSGLDILSSERVLEEYFKGFNLPGEGGLYLKLLNNYYNDTGVMYNIIDVYRHNYQGEIYSFIYYLLGSNIEKLKKTPGEYRGTTLYLFFIVYSDYFQEKIQKITKSVIEKQDNINDFDLIDVLFGIRESFSNKELKKLFIIYLNKLINEGYIDKDYGDKFLYYINNFLKKGYLYNQSDIAKLLNITDYEKFVIDNNIEKKDISIKILEIYKRYLSNK